MSHENAYQTQLKSRRMCLNDAGNVSHVERSPHFNFLGPRSMIFAAVCAVHSHKASCMEVAAGTDSSDKKGIMCHLERITK